MVYLEIAKMKTLSISILLISLIFLISSFIISCGGNPDVGTPGHAPVDEAVKTNPTTGSIRGKIVPPIAGTVITVYIRRSVYKIYRG